MNIRRLSSDTLCLTCEDDIREGERAHVEPRVGAWHLDCSTPLNLRIYQRERDRATRRHRRYDSAQYDA
jgi:hypothetical protein